MKFSNTRVNCHIVMAAAEANAKTSVLDQVPRAKLLMFYNDVFHSVSKVVGGIEELVFFLKEHYHDTIVIELGAFFRDANDLQRTRLTSILRAAVEGNVQHIESTRNMSFMFVGKLILIVNDFDHVPHSLKNRAVLSRI